MDQEDRRRKRKRRELHKDPSGSALTRERREEEQGQREVQQLDFGSLLGRRDLQTSSTISDQGHLMDFKTNLKSVKGKAEEKVNSSQQVDFRSVLGKKGTANTNGSKPTNTPTKNAADFRSVLANKKNPLSPEKNGEKVNNCVDGELPEQKTGGGGGGGGAPEFVEKLKDLTVLDGQPLRLQCRLTATEAAVTWTLDGKVIKPSKFIILSNEGQRSHTHVTHTHTHVNNMLGSQRLVMEEEELMKLRGFRLY